MALQELLEAARQPLAFPIAPQAQIAALQAERQQQGAQEMQRRLLMRRQMQAIQQDAQRFLQEMQERQFAQGQRRRGAAMAPALETLDIAGAVGGQEAAAQAARSVTPQLRQFGINLPPIVSPRERARAELQPAGGVQGLLRQLAGMTQGQDPFAAALQVGTAAAPYGGALKELGVTLPDYGEILSGRAQRDVQREQNQRMLQAQQIQAAAQIANQVISQEGLDRRELWKLEWEDVKQRRDVGQRGEAAAGFGRVGRELVPAPSRERLFLDALKARGLAMTPHGEVVPSLDRLKAISQAQGRAGIAAFGNKIYGQTPATFKNRQQQMAAVHDQYRRKYDRLYHLARDPGLPLDAQRQAKAAAQDAYNTMMEIGRQYGISRTSRPMSGIPAYTEAARKRHLRISERGKGLRQKIMQLNDRINKLESDYMKAARSKELPPPDSQIGRQIAELVRQRDALQEQALR